MSTPKPHNKDVRHQESTERKQAEEQNLNEMAFLKLALDAQRDTFFLFDPASAKALRWNQAFKDITGYSDEEIARLPAPASYYSPEDLERAIPFMEAVLSKGTGRIELDLICKDGSKVPTEYDVSTIKDKEGIPKYFVSIGRDITTRRQVAGALTEERDKAQQYLDIAGVILIALDTEGKVTLLNQKGSEILGYDQEEINGKDWIDHFIPARMKREVRSVFNQVMAAELEATQYFENAVVTKDGEEKIIAWHNSILKDAKGNITGTLSSGEDITARVQTEERLRDSEAKFRSIFESSAIGIMLTDSSGKFISINEAGSEMLGYSYEQIKNLSFLDLTHPDDHEISAEMYATYQREKKPFSLEKRYVTRKKEIIWSLTTVSPVLAEDESILYNVVQIQDITTSKEARQALQQERDFSQRLIETAPAFFVIADASGKVIMMNQLMLDSLGYSEEEVIGKDYLQLFVPADEHDDLRDTFKKLTDYPEMTVNENHILTRDRQQLLVEWHGCPIEDPDAENREFFGVGIDITQRKQTENELEYQHNLMRALIDALPVVLYAKDTDHRYIIGNQEFAHRYGLDDPGQLIGGTDLDNYPKDEAEQYHQDEDKILETQEPEIEISGYWLDKDGNERSLENSKFPFCDKQGQVLGIVGVSRDITERRQMEAELRTTQLHYTDFINSSFDEVTYWKVPDGLKTDLPVNEQVKLLYDIVLIDSNKAGWEKLGFNDKEEVIGKQYQELLRSKNSDELFTEFIKNDYALVDYIHWELLEADREYHSLDTWYGAVEDGRLTHIWATGKDITELKIAEKQLSDSETQTRTMLDHLPSVVWRSDAQGRTTFISSNVKDIYGYTEEEILSAGSELWLGRIHPDDLDLLQEDYQKLFAEGRPMHVEYRIQRKDGKWIWLNDRANFIQEVDDVSYAYGVFTDITERKLIEKELRQTQMQYTEFINASTDEVSYWKMPDGLRSDLPVEQQVDLLLQSICLDANKASWRRVGAKSRDSFVGKSLGELTVTDQYVKVLREFIENDYRFHNHEIEVYLRDGSWLVSLENWFGVIEDGLLTHIWVNSKDITDLRQTTTALEESEARFRNLIQGLPTGVSVTSYTGEILESNPALLNILGYDTKEELLAATATEHWVNPGDRERYWQTASEGPVRDYEVQLSRKDGTPIWISMDSITLSGEGGSRQLLNAMHDISERKQAQQQLEQSHDQLRLLSRRLESIQEEERARLSRDIHDDLGQSLTAIGMDLNRLRKHLPQDSEAQIKEFDELVDLVKTTSTRVQQLSAYLRPGILDDLGLIPAMEWYLSGIADRRDLEVSFDLPADPDLFNPEITTAIYRILQETMTNVFRHAEASSVTVELKEDGEDVIMSVSDDGVGMSEEQISNPLSIGLLGIRERLIPWDGRLEISGGEGRGTRVMVRVPVENILEDHGNDPHRG